MISRNLYIYIFYTLFCFTCTINYNIYVYCVSHIIVFLQYFSITDLINKDHSYKEQITCITDYARVKFQQIKTVHTVYIRFYFINDNNRIGIYLTNIEETDTGTWNLCANTVRCANTVLPVIFFSTSHVDYGYTGYTSYTSCYDLEITFVFTKFVLAILTPVHGYVC